MTSKKHLEYSLCHRKPPLKFEIESLFRQVMVYSDTKQKINTHTRHTHIIVKSILSSLRSEYKIY